MTEKLKQKPSPRFNIKANPLVPILKFYWMQWTLALCLLIIAASVTLSIPLAFKDIIDIGAESKKLDEKFLNLLALSIRVRTRSPRRRRRAGGRRLRR